MSGIFVLFLAQKVGMKVFLSKFSGPFDCLSVNAIDFGVLNSSGFL